MKIMVNKKIRKLFGIISVGDLLLITVSAVLVFLQVNYAALATLVAFLCMSLVSLAALYFYFRDQNQEMEKAVSQIRDYIAGNQSARIECEEEGELYRLFHEVNALVSILNAHAKKEGTSKVFLKNTISDISHQLKTPLASLNIYNGILQEESKELPEIREFADLSEQELDRIEILVQSLLKITKMDAGAVVMDKKKENLSELMHSIEAHFSFRAKQEEKKLILSGSDSDTLLCDRNWIIEAVSNIVKNAFDHTNRGNTINIEWKQFASFVQIVVRDNGCGIHPQDRYHIFKRFYRSQFSKDTQGIGLGLPLAKAIVEAHDGTIEVDSEPGQGAAFIMNFLIPTEL